MATPKKVLTVAEARLRRLEIEQEIERLLADFEEQSGCAVERVGVYQSRQIGIKGPRVSIKANIEL